MTTRIILSISLVLSLLAAFAAGYAVGRSSEQTLRQPLVQDAVLSKTLIGVEKDLVTLTHLRERKPVVPDLELWVSSQLHTLTPSGIAQGTASDFVLPRVVASLSAYRARFPDTALDPARDENVARVLSVSK